MVVEPGMKHSWYIFISSNGNQLRRTYDSCNDMTLSYESEYPTKKIFVQIEI